MIGPTATVELVWQDETGSTAATVLHAPSSLTLDEIDVRATALASIVASMTNCTLVRQRIKWRSDAATRLPASGSTPVVSVGAFFFATEGDNADGIVLIPSIKNALLVHAGPTDGYAIDLSNADVIAFGELLVDNGFSNIFGDALTSLVAAYRQSRR